MCEVMRTILHWSIEVDLDSLCTIPTRVVLVTPDETWSAPSPCVIPSVHAVGRHTDFGVSARIYICDPYTHLKDMNIISRMIKCNLLTYNVGLWGVDLWVDDGAEVSCVWVCDSLKRQKNAGGVWHRIFWNKLFANSTMVPQVHHHWLAIPGIMRVKGLVSNRPVSPCDK